MIDFDQAIDTARKNVTKMIPGAKNILLEQALISEDHKLFEITYSYDNETKASFSSPGNLNLANAHLQGLAGLMRNKREQKVFLIDSENGSFRGFRNL